MIYSLYYFFFFIIEEYLYLLKYIINFQFKMDNTLKYNPNEIELIYYFSSWFNIIWSFIFYLLFSEIIIRTKDLLIRNKKKKKNRYLCI